MPGSELHTLLETGKTKEAEDSYKATAARHAQLMRQIPDQRWPHNWVPTDDDEEWCAACGTSRTHGWADSGLCRTLYLLQGNT